MNEMPPEARPPRATRPAHHRPELLALIALGGSAGTAGRAVLEQAFPAPAGQWPWATLAVNLTGAFLLGLLLEYLARRGPDTGWRRVTRLGAGTGLLGGYTTYSTFAVETLNLALPLAVGYALVTTALGALAAAAGFLIARTRPLRPAREPGA
ncbi:MAG: CrcB family protein [Kineosporiaceae bacterium]|nr:CrcB family protein [Kineosporiaceae bacterium]